MAAVTTAGPGGRTGSRSGRVVAAGLLSGAYLLVVLLPLIVALGVGAPRLPGLHDLSSSLAMVGFAVLLLEFVFSGRFRLLTDLVGMDALMRFHQFSGYVVLVLLLAHPYLYAFFPAATGPIDGGVATGSGGSGWAGVTGFIAWFGLIALVFMAMFRDELPIPYERWRLGHGLGAAAIAVLALVHTLGAGTTASAAAVGGVWIAGVVLALATLAHVYVIKPWLQLRRPWHVEAVTQLAPAIHELTVAPSGHRGLDYRAGQFVWLRIAPRPWGLREHPFSLACAPGDGATLRFVIKANGDYTRRIGEIEPGARAWIDGPYGRFGRADGDAAALLFIAGGVGLAPILGLLRDRLQAGDPRPMRLIHACRRQRDMILADELAELQRGLDLEVVRVVDEAGRAPGTWPGPVDRDLLQRCLAHAAPERTHCRICAPPGMIDAMETMLVELGVAPSRITSERFRYRFGAASPLARRARRVYLALAGMAVVAAIAFAAAG